MSSPLESHDQDLTSLRLLEARLYHLYLASHEDFGVATGGSATTIADSSKNWGTNTWTNFMCMNVSTGEERVISSNTAHVLTVAAWDRVPIRGNLYKICGPNWVFESAAQPNLRVSLWNGANEAAVSQLSADGQSAPIGPSIWNFPLAFNTAGTFDRIRNNVNLYNVSNTTTTTFTGADISTYNARALLIVIDCTTLTGTSYTPEVDWKDGAGNYPVLWKQSTAKTATARTFIALGPGSAGAVVDAGAAAGDAGLGTVDSATAAQLVQIPFAVPNTIRIVITKSAVTAFTANLQVQGS